MLNVVTGSEAVEIIRNTVQKLTAASEKVNIKDSSGHVISEDVTAAESIPPFDRSTVDGYAVCAEDTFGAGEAIPAELECSGAVAMGSPADIEIHRGQCAEILTGGMLPKGANAVVMVENTRKDLDSCLVYSGVAPGENIAKKGSDINAGDVAVKKGTVIGPSTIGVLAALGIYDVPVFKKPVIAVISTGDEIVTGTPENGQIRDINTYLLSSCAEKAGCEVYSYGSVKDDKDLITAAVKKCVEAADAVLISGGSSAGNMDMTCGILNELGTVYFHGIAVKPGKPTIFAAVNGKPVFGLPGHPLAAYFVFRLFVTEYLRALLEQPVDKPFTKAALSQNVPSNHGREEFICVKIDGDGRAEPLYTKSGMISVLAQADGFICIPRGSEGLDAGTEVSIYSL